MQERQRRLEARDPTSRGGFDGLWVALATSFRQDGSLDLQACSALTTRVVEGGAHGLVALGSTGEAATLDDDERERIVETVIAAARGLPVIVGCGSNDTREAVRFTRSARAAGANGALLVTPYYNKPNPDGLFAHFAAVAEAAADFPLMVYNVPGRTGQNLTPPNLARLWSIPSVVAIKESSGDLAQIDRMLRELPEGRTVLAGDDWIALAAIALGARGLVSVAGNVMPTEMRRLVEAALDGRLTEARHLHRALSPLMEALFLESNPVPLKAALAILGIADDTVRLPLSRASEETRRRLDGVLAGFREVAA
ncbi:MAG TPA: 4-hydroxy-tetrahydrodipicolinate synthase [Thermoanaerobaculia bacterium]|nr:4-hydroxy-tetrahydrodipicolinate synthase [Thermoanaerobaculia bacterium]